VVLEFNRFCVGEVDVLGIVHVVDDDASFRTAIQRRLQIAGYEVATYPDARQFLSRAHVEEEPSCLLLDVKIPDFSGLELQSQLNAIGSSIPIIFLTGHPDIRTSVNAVKAGAEDFLTKPVSSENLLQAVKLAISHHQLAIERKSRRSHLQALASSLTPRELQVFHLVIHGKINKQIAHELGTTERTIKAHRHQVMEKMKVKSVAELVSIAERLGIVD